MSGGGLAVVVTGAYWDFVPRGDGSRCFGWVVVDMTASLSGISSNEIAYGNCFYAR